MTEFNKTQQIKRRFFAMRNGIIADTLRKAGSPYKIIFGLNLPQIREIAAEFGPDADMARKLWTDSRTRESMLLAPWLMPEGELTAAGALEWLREAVSAEAVDILCLARLRNVAYCDELFGQLAADAEPLMQYAAMRLFMNNRDSGCETNALALARSLTEAPLCAPLARQVIWECSEEW